MKGSDGDEINRQQRIYDGINPNRKYEAEKNREAQITRFINDMLNQYAVFAGHTFILHDDKKQYIEGKVKKINFEFKWREE